MATNVFPNFIRCLLQTQKAEINALKKELEALRAERQTTGKSTIKPAPDLPPLDYKGTVDFREWKRTIAHNVMVKGDSIGSHKDQWVWIWSHLAAEVQRDLAVFFLGGGEKRKYHPGNFLEELDKRGAKYWS
jgi:hypothetical protein